ncbi:MAG: hypothetical protein CML68_20235 [Rhodobacteraceae bacterium]|nr:hypothetical protein [Paracoccaceae bacterium]
MAAGRQSAWIAPDFSASPEAAANANANFATPDWALATATSISSRSHLRRVGGEIQTITAILSCGMPSAKRTFIMTSSRMISGPVLKYLNRAHFVIREWRPSPYPILSQVSQAKPSVAVPGCSAWFPKRPH